MTTQSKQNNFTLSGRITNCHDEPIEGLVVLAFDKDRKSSGDLPRQAITNAKGRYTIRFVGNDPGTGGAKKEGPDVCIRVYEELQGETKVRRHTKGSIIVDVQVDRATENTDRKGSFTVIGQVTRSDGQPQPAMVVRAFDQGLRSRSNLGESTTSADGRYSIEYVKASLLAPERGSANLLVEVIGNAGNVLAESGVLFNARQQETINLTADTREVRSSEAWQHQL